MSDDFDFDTWIDRLRKSALGEALRAQAAEAEDAPSTKGGERWSGTIYGFCPVQGHGSVDNLFWHFRARGEEWRFEVYIESCEGELPGNDKLVWSADGEYEGDQHDAGWMKFSEAWSLIESCIAVCRESGFAMPTGGDS